MYSSSEPQQNFELYVVMSDLCNFSCAHCLNSSGPNSKRFRLTDVEIDLLIQTIEKNESISCVHFSGGEPSLAIEKIKKIQESVVRNVKYSMTTNGWFGNHPATIFDKIALDEIVLSYDKYHSPFIDISTLQNLCRDALSRNISVIINFGYESIEDFSAAQELLIHPSIHLKPATIIVSGRQASDTSKFVDKRSCLTSCPSLISRDNTIEKIHYLPGQGFTSCCGPLVFDGLASDQFTFSDSLNESPLTKQLKCGSFVDQYLAHNFDFEGSYSHQCEVCSTLYGRVAPNLPSLFELSQMTELPAIYAIKSLLPGKILKAAKPSLRFSFAYAGHPRPLPTHTSSEANAEIKMLTKWNKSIEQEVYNFIQRTAVAPFSEWIAEKSIKRTRQPFNSYIEICNLKNTYWAGDKLVGVLLLNEFEQNPYNNMPSAHIGFIGYDANLINIDEARQIKKAWLNHIFDFAGSRLITSLVDSFNMPSHSFHRSISMAPIAVKVERN
jgi:organic radical activating enzyme